MNFINYCIITNRVSSMGGAQLYTLRRAKHLKSKGIHVSIIVKDNSNFILKEEFRNIPILLICDLIKSPSLKTKKSRKKVIESIKIFSNLNSNSIIESHSPILSLWGELISSSLKCKHIIYLLAEPRLYSNNSTRPYYDFYQWKYRRNELLGLSNMSLKLIFGVDYDSNQNNYVNVPFDISEIKNTTEPSFIEKIETDTFVIGTVSRLAKTYVETLIEEVLKLKDKYRHQNFCLIVAGDDANKEILQNLKKKYEGHNSNLKILFPGYLNPIGKDFFKNIDVFVGMGTAVISSISQKCATITVDPDVDNASGIFGVTNNNFAYSESGKLFAIGDLIELLLNDQILLKEAQIKGYTLFNNEFSVSICMKKLDNFILSHPNDNHWNTDSFFYLPVVFSSLFSSVTSKIYLKLKSLIRKLFNPLCIMI